MKFHILYIILVKCCPTISITATGPALTAQPDAMGTFEFYRTGDNKRPIYKNSKNEYLYYDNDGDVAVSKYSVYK